MSIQNKVDSKQSSNSIGQKVSNTLGSIANVGTGIQNSVSSKLSEFSSKVSINAGADFLQSNSIVAKFVFLTLVFILFVVICNLGIRLIGYFTEPKKNPYIVYGLLQGTNAAIISQDPSQTNSIPVLRSNNQSKGMEFSWSIWLLIANNSNNNKTIYRNIFNKGDSIYDNTEFGNGMSTVNNGPGLYLKSKSTTDQNSLHVVMDSVDPSEGPSIIDVEGVPFNKWFHVTIRLENKILDVYINGTIASRYNMKSVPKQNYNDVNVCQNGGFNGNISNLRYFDYALSAFEINRIVMKGPNISTSSLSSSVTNKSSSYYFLSSQWFSGQS